MAQDNIKVDYITRVEGQGALDIWLSGDGELKDLKLNVYEPPRFFEALMVGRKYDEVHEIAARICGICPVSHEISALRSVEDALGLEVSEATREMRKLLAMSAYISSHVLSIYFLSLPDYLGYRDLLEAARTHGDLLKRALKLKKLGNDITELVGGRSVHPVTAVIGRFTNTISREQATPLIKRLEESREDALKTVELVGGLEFPKFNRKCEHVALCRGDEYAINEGNLASTEGMDVPQKDYRRLIEEKQLPGSNGKHSTVKGRRAYLVGPLARVNLNFESLSEGAKQAAKSVGFRTPSFNPFQSPLARAIEVVHSVDKSIELFDSLPYNEEQMAVNVSAGEGFAITEAPRGINYHNYRLDRNGVVTKSDIAPPTCQNYANIEADLREFVPEILDKPENEIADMCQVLIRSYDPCISCSVHSIRIHK